MTVCQKAVHLTPLEYEVESNDKSHRVLSRNLIWICGAILTILLVCFVISMSFIAKENYNSTDTNACSKREAGVAKKQLYNINFLLQLLYKLYATQLSIAQSTNFGNYRIENNKTCSINSTNLAKWSYETQLCGCFSNTLKTFCFGTSRYKWIVCGNDSLIDLTIRDRTNTKTLIYYNQSSFKELSEYLSWCLSDEESCAAIHGVRQQSNSVMCYYYFPLKGLLTLCFSFDRIGAFVTGGFINETILTRSDILYLSELSMHWKIRK